MTRSLGFVILGGSTQLLADKNQSGSEGNRDVEISSISNLTEQVVKIWFHLTGVNKNYSYIWKYLNLTNVYKKLTHGIRAYPSRNNPLYFFQLLQGVEFFDCYIITQTIKHLYTK